VQVIAVTMLKLAASGGRALTAELAVPPEASARGLSGLDGYCSDLFLLCLAMRLRVPFVCNGLCGNGSLSRFAAQPDIIEWLAKEGSELRVQFSFDADGTFRPSRPLPPWGQASSWLEV
jgi:hypothetical protein